MVSLMLLTERQVNEAFERNIKDIDLVLGAKGSPLQLILANVYHIDAPTGNINQREAEKVLKHPYIASGIPLAYGDNHEGYRIVGTEHSYVEHYGATLGTGNLWEAPFEVTAGARVLCGQGVRGLVRHGGEPAGGEGDVRRVLQPEDPGEGADHAGRCRC